VTPRVAVVVGSGFADLAGDGPGENVATRFGPPSAPIRTLRLGAAGVRVLARHGDDHRLPPHAINYRANLLALKETGADAVICVNTVGAVTDLRAPGDIAVPDQIIDYTWGREHTIHDGEAARFEHVDFTAPFSQPLREALLSAADAAGVDCYDGGVYAATQGPRLETAAEVRRLARDGADFVGMTGMPEAGLARELGMDAAFLSLIVNLAAGRGEQAIHDEVESFTAMARTRAIAVLEYFFR